MPFDCENIAALVEEDRVKLRLRKPDVVYLAQADISLEIS